MLYIKRKQKVLSLVGAMKPKCRFSVNFKQPLKIKTHCTEKARKCCSNEDKITVRPGIVNRQNSRNKKNHFNFSASKVLSFIDSCFSFEKEKKPNKHRAIAFSHDARMINQHFSGCQSLGQSFPPHLQKLSNSEERGPSMCVPSLVGQATFYKSS